MDLECNMSEIIWQGKFNRNRRCVHEILWWNAAIVPGDRHIWSPTQSCPTIDQTLYKLPKRQSTTQQYTQTHHICKQKLIKCRKKTQQHWKRGTRYTTWAWEVPSLLLCKSGEYNNRSQTTTSNLKEKCSSAISGNTMNSFNTPIQSKNHIQTWTKSIHSRLALQTKPQRKQR